MRLGQPLRNLRRDFNCLSHRQQAGAKQLAQRLPLYQLHRDVVSGTVLSEFVDGNDIGVVEGRCRARFLLEAVQPIIVCGERGGQNLDRNNAVQARVPRPIHLAHPAGAQQLDNLIRSELRARGEYHFRTPLYSQGRALQWARLFRVSLAYDVSGLIST